MKCYPRLLAGEMEGHGWKNSHLLASTYVGSSDSVTVMLPQRPMGEPSI